VHATVECKIKDFGVRNLQFAAYVSSWRQNFVPLCIPQQAPASGLISPATKIASWALMIQSSGCITYFSCVQGKLRLLNKNLRETKSRNSSGLPQVSPLVQYKLFSFGRQLDVILRPQTADRRYNMHYRKIHSTERPNKPQIPNLAVK
jgi:hypothetical protein